MYADIVNTESLLTTNKPIALILFSSPRKSGFTYKLTKDYIREIKNDYDIKFIDCYNIEVSPCKACNYCKKNINCCINDNFKEIRYFLEKASLLVIATPVYNMSFPAPLKAIIDRTQIYFNARFYRNIRPPIAQNKKGVLISVCGSNDSTAFDIIISQIKKSFTILNTTLDECILLNNTDNLDINSDFSY